MSVQIDIDRQRIDRFCRKWKIAQVSLFGSVLRDDFRLDSDVDVLVDLRPDADWGLLEHARMQDELSDLIGRKADLVTRRSVERSRNWLRRKAILESAEVFHVTR